VGSPQPASTFSIGKSNGIIINVVMTTEWSKRFLEIQFFIR